ncbi:hypothetical protein B7P43_G10003 [Cryptotermes secundus]|uniref:Uncharacterized protein n=1 Tax=Cryptotermes secundus TaxID=105785 RepID=A0A2J7RFK1_9NEOP|nr:hypothetical protein B7P43_G10003 [Cryptotermes secundus]
MNNYQAAAAAAAQGFGPPASPHAAAAAAAANSRGGFPPANSPGPIDMYSSSAADSVAGYVQAASPQPSGFPTLAVSVKIMVTACQIMEESRLSNRKYNDWLLAGGLRSIPVKTADFV